jgi:hypothetical protein
VGFGVEDERFSATTFTEGEQLLLTVTEFSIFIQQSAFVTQMV